MTANQITWAILTALAITALTIKGPQIAESLGNGLSPRFITVFDSSQFDHTRGVWNIETGKKVRK
jgi:hypothetical protein